MDPPPALPKMAIVAPTRLHNRYASEVGAPTSAGHKPLFNNARGLKGFVVLPRRWVVERTFAWLNRNRRLAKDFENSIASATAWIFMASVQLLPRRIARL